MSIASQSAFVRSILALLTRQERLRAILLLGIIVAAAAFEAVGIGLVLPLIAVISAPESLAKFPLFAGVFDRIGIDAKSTDAVAMVGGLLAAAFVAKNAFLAYATHFQARFTQDVFVSIARRLFLVYLACPYEFHLHHNSTLLMRSVSGDSHSIAVSFLRPAFLLLSELAVVVSVCALLLVVNPVVTVVCMIGLSLFGFALHRALRGKVIGVGETFRLHNGLMLKWLTQAIVGVKEVKVLHRERFFVDGFIRHGEKYARGNADYQLLQLLPRLLLETVLVFVIVGGVFLAILQPGGREAVAPLLALFVAAALRLLPSTSRMIASLQQVDFSLPSLKAVRDDLGLVSRERIAAMMADPGRGATFPFEREIRFKNVSFRYRGAASLALKSVDLTVERGSSVGIVGPSGAGKSTLIDVIMGLLEPTQGTVLVDGRDLRADLRAWQRRIGYIPQEIFLLDNTVRRNVAFGVPDEEIDEGRVARAVAAAQLDSVLAELPDGLDTEVGERGIRLSGGQRQRIAIARSLYNDADVLVLDEATAALDNETEREVNRAIERLSGARTIIVIAHRLTSVRNCDRIHFMSDGRIVASGTYDELIADNVEFRRMALVAEA
jgi:ATP-binding cassette subfamily C protein